MEAKSHLMELKEYEEYLRREERSKNTIEKYLRDLRGFFTFLEGDSPSKEGLLRWKSLLVQTYAPASVNSMLAAVNSFFDFLELPQWKVKPLKIQREIFSRPEKELTQGEYSSLVQTARDKHNERLALVLQALCGTGMRVSELRCITVAAVQMGRAIVDCKGKTRTVFLPKALCQTLRRYCKEQKIEQGPVFCTAKGAPLHRSNIWRDMKNLCRQAGVPQGKVFPHNLRHLFARTYYTLEKDLSRLADLLGHTSVATTRIYTMESGAKHLRQLDRMGLVLDNKRLTT